MYKITLEIANYITLKLNENQESLALCKWTDGESNTDTDYSVLACKYAEEGWLSIKVLYPEMKEIDMEAKIPDVHCIFSKDGIKVSENKIELKSSKSVIIPGSTIGKLDINQALIYCYRGEKYEVKCGQYHTAMGSSDIDLFQDRTPRPQLNFSKLCMDKYVEKKKEDWIPHYGKCAVNRLIKNISNSWQDSLTKSIILEAINDIETIEELHNLREMLRGL